jgi:hypothetical protein
LQCFPSFALRHLGPQPKNHRDPISLLFVQDRIIDDFAEVPVPLLAAGRNKSPLVFCSHSSLSSVAGTIGPAFILPAFPPQRGQAFSFVDKLFDLAEAITKDAITHANHG